MNTLPRFATVVTVSPLQVLEARTPDELWFDGFQQYADCVRTGEDELWFDGFQQYADCVRTGDYLTAGELASMTSQERKGYNDAISAADYAEYTQYRESRNAWGDLTMGGW